MALLAPPEDLQMNGNLEEEWPLFKQRFLLYLKATGAAQWPNGQKVALFLTVAGPEALKLYNSFQLDPEEAEDIEAVLARFEEHCMPRRKEVYERFLFRTRLQEPHESFEDFVADLQRKSNLCNFGSQRELLVRDQIVLGCRDSHARQQLLQRDELTLQDALKICRVAEAKVDSQCDKDPLRQLEVRAAAKRTRFQVANVRDSNTLPSRQELRRIRSTVNKTDGCWQRRQQYDDCLRKESFKTYV